MARAIPPRRPAFRSRRVAQGKHQNTVVTILGSEPSYAFSTFTTNDWDFTADNVDDATDTLTVYDSNGALMVGAEVVFTSEDTFVDAATCTLETDAAEIETTTGTANITARVYNAAGTPLPGIPAASLSLASTGTGNTITAVDTVTDRNGRFRWTFVSTVAEAKTLTLTALGIVVTDTVAVTTTGTPSGPTLVFETIWSNTGTSSTILRDTASSTPWENIISPSSVALSVVNAASDGVGTGCPTTNCMRVDLVYNGDTIQNMDTKQVTNLPGGGAWSIPGVGDSLYFCVYKHLVYPQSSDPGSLGSNNHCLEQASGGGNDWSWSFNTAAGGWQPSFNLWNSGAATRYSLGGPSVPVYLNRDVWYRLEWRVQRTGTTTCEFEVRIYNAAGTLVYDTDDMLTTGSVPLTGVSKTITDVNRWDALQLGTNGPHVIGATQGASPAWYFAAPRVSATDWIGAY